MKKNITILLFFCVMQATAQKKLVAVAQSGLTGVVLPAGTKQDSRMLYVMAGEILLEMETKKAGTGIKNTEILYLPAVSDCGFNADSLVAQLGTLGWSITPVEGDDKYVWLQKNGRYLVVYLSMGKKQTDLYIAEATSVPAITGAAVESTVATDATTTVPAVQVPDQNTSANSNLTNSNLTVTPVQGSALPAQDNGITMATTNFDDGWTAVAASDYVQVSKEDVTVLLHYGIPVPDDMKGVYEPKMNYFWNLLVAPGYAITDVRLRPYSSMDYPAIYFMEGDGTAGGRSVHIAFRIFLDNGVASCVEIVTSSKTAYDRSFPNLDNIEKMLNYNKFAVSPADVTGTWENSSGSSAQYYNAYTGNYAGMSMSSSYDKFVFNPGDQYQQEFKGVSGMVGSAQFAQQKNNGVYAVTNWELSTTDQNGKKSVYSASYQAVKNGRVLHLQNKQYSGSQFHLTRSR